jgi:galactonate dehydratase
MKITKVETIRYRPQPNILWVRIHTDEGLIGLGETFYLPGAVEAVVHDLIAGFLLGSSPFDRERIGNNVFSWTNFFGYAGAEMRALSAVDIALWDIVGQYTGQPIYNLLGGMCRDRLRVYNTCVNGGPYNDFTDFLERPAELAADLFRRGIKALKIWPWDQFAPSFQDSAPAGPTPWAALGPSGSYLSAEDLEKGLQCVKKVREALGNKIEVLIEGHSRWDLNCAIRIARALEPYDPLWMEDMMKPDSAHDLARLARETRVPHAVSERLFTRYAFRQILEAQAARVVIADLVWTGGITEGRKIAALADTFHLPIAPHDCTGLVALFANIHLSAASPNAMILETVRGFYEGWYREAYTESLVIQEGFAHVPKRPGLGTSLRVELLGSSDVSVRLSAQD